MIILKAENISKQYRLGNVGTGTLSHDLNRFWHRVRGKEDPYLKVGSVNDRGSQAKTEYIWALKDINFEVRAGEVLGIIGKNGAGKSTLLKILSRVTSPSTGVIKTKGRIASLLEVGTGFHPELTGRENVFLNGAILGMTRAEITAKLEEIVEFSGCELYIDTPVKRYSSGMKVRLAFAVAAHLEPDILVVDEVLAVGDAEFQKKAIGKMQDISTGQGRTVLFVSHNMAAVQDLCQRVLVLENGGMLFDGATLDGVEVYLKNRLASEGFVNFNPKEKFHKAQIIRFEILNSSNKISDSYNSGEPLIFKAFIKVSTKLSNPIFSLRISDINSVNIINWRSNDYVLPPLPKDIAEDFTITITSMNLFLLDNIYSVSISFLDGKEVLDYYEKFIHFEVLPSKPDSRFYSMTRSKTTNCLVFSEAEWKVEKI